MGYISTVSGELTFTPHLVGGEIDSITTLVPEYLGYFLNWRIEELTLPTTVVVGGREAATTARVQVTTELYAIGHSGKAYQLEEEVRALVAELAGSGRVVNGRLRVEGEESSDVWRITVNDNDVTVEHAALVWPDGERESR